MAVKLFEVGGCVRDEILGIPSKDIDFACEADGGWDEMRQWLLDHGFTIFLETPEFLTIRAHFPKGQLFAGQDMSRHTADFVLCRSDGTYSDGRRPDTVTPGTIFDDLRRRDFTVNAIAKGEGGTFIDPHDGIEDIATMTLRCVGNAEERITEDALRALRAIRFRITKGFRWDDELRRVMTSQWLPRQLGTISVERIREELFKCFKADTPMTLDILCHELPPEFRDAVFANGLWLRPTLEEA